MRTADSSRNFICKEIEDWITGKIISGEYRVGEKIPSIKMLADHFDVCRSTIDRAVKDLTANGILECRPRTGCFVKKRLASTLLNSILVVLPDIRDHFFYLMTIELEHALRRAGYLMLLVNSHEDGEKELDLLNSFKHNENIKGCIINSCTRELNRLSSRPMPFPVVFTGMKVDNMAVDFVTLSVFDAIKQAFDYLYNLGHRRFGYLRKLTSLKKDTPYIILKLHHKKQDLAFEKRWTVSSDAKDDFTAGQETMRQLLKQDDLPTAVFTSSDALASGAAEAAMSAGLKIPDDLSIIGWGNDPFYLGRPAYLTTIDYTMGVIAWETVKLLAQRISNNSPAKPKEIYFPGELVVRDTSAPPAR